MMNCALMACFTWCWCLPRGTLKSHNRKVIRKYWPSKTHYWKVCVWNKLRNAMLHFSHYKVVLHRPLSVWHQLSDLWWHRLCQFNCGSLVLTQSPIFTAETSRRGGLVSGEDVANHHAAKASLLVCCIRFSSRNIRGQQNLIHFQHLVDTYHMKQHYNT